MDIFAFDKKKYGGKYVATPSFSSTEVVTYGKDPTVVYKRAVKRGHNEPVINFVPGEGVTCLY